MAKVDDVTVQPLTTYMEGAEHKTPRSEPYKVPRWHGSELEALGHARIVGGEEAPAPEGEADAETEDRRAPAIDEATIENDGKPRGRRGTARS
ncbi:hypothetical protein [Methylorubrum populi]|uniref:Uncharacterized protein n=1 Tax=Methylorubrum populi TaxID=223967 RepID=A0A833J3M5_9HYPH|nr:hypothetical protein [Methylorubrum populi]KAB7783474.1 hypothetical protein F8B43_4036 [Methylorubrum populi]